MPFNDKNVNKTMKLNAIYSKIKIRFKCLNKIKKIVQIVS